MTDDTGGTRCDGDFLGRLAYLAYGEQMEWTAYNGERIPPWEDQDAERRTGWMAAAAAVMIRLTTLGDICAVCNEKDCPDPWLW